MTGLTGIFKAAPEERQDNDKLVDLFRNRAELKKEFAALRNEKYRLQERVKQQLGATARVQQKMDHLESLLLDREWVHNVVAFYQLRRLEAHCAAKLARFAEQLKQQRENRINDAARAEWRKRRDEQAAEVEQRIDAHRLRLQLVEDQLRAERQRLAGLNGVAKVLKGKSLHSDLQQIEEKLAVLQARENELLAELDQLQNLAPPEPEGLDTATKRSINCMILAFAQQLYLHFAEDDLAALAKEANEKSVGAVNYGSKQDCDVIIERIEKRWDSMESPTAYADVLQKRASLIAEHARFRSDADAVPAPGTAAIVYAIDANGVVKEKDVNLIGDNYFGITKVISR